MVGSPAHQTGAPEPPGPLLGAEYSDAVSLETSSKRKRKIKSEIRQCKTQHLNPLFYSIRQSWNKDTKWHLKSVVRYRKSSVLGPVVNNQAIHKPKLAKWSSLCQKGIHLVGSWRIFILCLRRVPTAHFKYEVERYKMN